jgi:hypothetical protein
MNVECPPYTVLVTGAGDLQHWIFTEAGRNRQCRLLEMLDDMKEAEPLQWQKETKLRASPCRSGTDSLFHVCDLREPPALSLRRQAQPMAYV